MLNTTNKFASHLQNTQALNISTLHYNDQEVLPPTCQTIVASEYPTASPRRAARRLRHLRRFVSRAAPA